MRRALPFGTTLLALVALAGSSAGRADWLVLQDGSQFEVKGSPKTSANRVVFTTLDGKLSSLRADQVDLEASRRATEEARLAAEPKQEGPKEPAVRTKPKWSLTDKDFARKPAPEPGEAGAGAPGAGQEGGAAAPAAPKSDLEVLVWSKSIDPARNRIRVSGTLQNSGENMAASIELAVQLVDREGVIVGERNAALGTGSLGPGETTEFSATFIQIVNFDVVKFAPAGTMLKLNTKKDEGQVEEKAPPGGK